VTRWTAVWRERISRITLSACWRTGPIRANPATSLLTLRNRATLPVGGASSTTASYNRPPPRRSRVAASITFPVSSTSRIPGAIVVAKSIAPIFFRADPARRRL